MLNEGPITITAGEALAKRRLVKPSGSSVIYADAGDEFIGVTEYAIASAAKGAIREKNQGGKFEVTAAAAITAGAMIYPAADGKVSMVPTGKAIGFALQAATAAGDIIEAVFAEIDARFAGLACEAVADNKTLDAQDVGKLFYVTADAKTITLPATVAGLGPIVIMNGGADAGVAVKVSPNANDKIMGPDVAGTDNKDQINTKTTAKRGDYIVITGDGANGWWISAKRGTWAEEA